MTAFQVGLFEPTLDDIEEQIESAKTDVENNVTDFTVEIMVKKMNPDLDTGLPAEIDIPEYQRPFVWSSESQSKYIESLLLNLPVPYLFLSQRPDGRLEVVDGSQRLRTMQAFLGNDLVLTDLEKLGILNGLRFDSLPVSQQRILRNRPVKAVVFSSKADENTRFDVFQRINAEGMRLSDAQIRKGAMKGAFYDLVLACARKPLFESMCRVSNRKDPGGERAELVLRFFAYSDRYLDFVHDVARFLNVYVKDQNADSHLDVNALEARFDRMLQYVHEVFPYGFRKSSASSEVPRVRFEAIAVGSHLAIESGKLNPSPDFSWLTTKDFSELTRTDASNSGPRLRGRIEFVRDHLML